MSDESTSSLGHANKDDKLWIILSHLSVFLGVGILLPLIVYLVKKEDSPIVAKHAKEALNFHITMFIMGFVAFLLCFVLIGFPLLVCIGLGTAVCSIIAAMKASDGKFFKYPLTLRLIS